MELINLNDIKPAPYNPRVLSADAYERLKKSIGELGVMKPILINDDSNIIIAGHQRTKAMLELGIKQCYGYKLKNISAGDEMRLNQLHNANEIEISDNAPKLCINNIRKEQLQLINPEQITVLNAGTNRVAVAEIGKLILKYGQFATPICSESGEVLVSSSYAFASYKLKIPFECFVVKDQIKERVVYYFSQKYGEFCYDKLEKKTYIQNLAQLVRKGKQGRQRNSTTYAQLEKYLKTVSNCKSLRILDFGAGRYEFARMYQDAGFDITYVDPYHCVEGTKKIDIAGNTYKFRKIISDIENIGLYDVVICDSVLNSVDSVRAHDAVINSCRALCKKGGVIFISGRCLEKVEQGISSARYASRDSFSLCLDENNFTALFRDGQWYYQKYHNYKQIVEVGKLISASSKDFEYIIKTHQFILKAKNTNTINEDLAIKALRFEFDMILPNGKHYGLQDEIERAYINRKL